MDRDRYDNQSAIVFPRISNKHGPAQTVRIEQAGGPGSVDESPEYDPLRFGVADAFEKVATNRVPRHMVRMIPNTASSRNGQRFRGNYARADDATRTLINRRRGL